MNELLKIVVTDSGGEDHLFSEIAGETEHWLNLKDENGYVSIKTRDFNTDGSTAVEIDTTFISPRKVQAIYAKEQA